MSAMPFLKIYAVWFLLSVIVCPIILKMRIRLFGAWLAARAISPFFFALILMHILRWSGVAWGGYLFWLAVSVSGMLALPSYKKYKKPRVKEWRAVAELEIFLLLLAVLLFFIFAVNYGGGAAGERPLDLGLVTSLWCAPKFPPHDFWFSGHTLNTYYLGSWTYAALGRGAGALPHESYFGGLIILWMQVICAALLAARLFGFRGRMNRFFPIMILMIGHAGVIYNWFNGVSPISRNALIRLTRIIPYTINENPAVAFWVSELHAHVMALPLMLLWIMSLVLALRKKSYLLAAMSGTIGAMLCMTDMWLAIPSLICGFSILAVQKRPEIIFAIKAFPLKVAAALLVSSAFLIDYKSYPLRFLQVKNPMTTISQMLALFGVMLPFLAIIVYENKKRIDERRLGFSMIAAGILLIIFCEFIYLDNQFPPPGERQNTVFRFHYAAWIFLAIGICAAFPRKFKKHILSLTVKFLILLFFIGGNIIPALANLCYLMKEQPTSIDMRKGLDRGSSGKIEAAEWLFSHTSAGAVIVESAGAPYKRFATISSMSGRMAVLGEADKVSNHAIPAAMIRERLDDVYRIYLDKPESDAVLKKYGVKYIVLGLSEIQAFPGCQNERLIQKYETVFQAGETKILQTRADKN